MSSARRCATLTFAILVLFALPAQAAPEALFDLDSPAPAPADADRRAIELGVRFTTSARFRADGVAFYRAPESPIADGRVRIWKGYEEVASGTADSTSRSGWVRVAFTAGPVMLEPNTEYVASYSAPEGGYASTPNYFSRPLDPPGTALRAPTAAGVYLYQYFLSPVYSWEDSNYWVTPYGEPSVPTEPTEPPAEGPWALFDATTPVDNPATSDAERVEVGTRFSVSGDYVVRAIRVYRGQPMPEIRAYLYDETGTVVGSGEVIGEGGRSGVNEVTLRTPVKLRPGVIYTASYDARWGRYPENQQGFAAARTVGPVTFPAEAGVYRYGGGYPTSTWEASDYYVTPVVSKG